MREDDVVISDVEYLLAERLVQSWINQMSLIAEQYIMIIGNLIESGVEDEAISNALRDLTDPFFRFLQEYSLSPVSFIDNKMENFIDKIDEIDRFMY